MIKIIPQNQNPVCPIKGRANGFFFKSDLIDNQYAISVNGKRFALISNYEPNIYRIVSMTSKKINCSESTFEVINKDGKIVDSFTSIRLMNKISKK